MKISFIIPTYNEEKALKSNFKQFMWLKSKNCEIIVIDAHSNDNTREIARKFADKIKIAPKKISLQENMGAKLAEGDYLFFMYPDVILPKGFELLINYLNKSTSLDGGGFRRRWKPYEKKAYFGLFDRYSDWRIWLLKTFPGDHLIFVKRSLFKKIGGFPDLWLMHDIDFCRRIKKHNKIICFKNPVLKSPRRLNREGYFKTYFKWFLITIIYYLLADFKKYFISVSQNYLKKGVR